LPERIVVDCSHANSRKDPARQPMVLEQVIRAILDDAARGGGGGALVGAMLESNLLAGAQKLVPGAKLLRGVSVTDACIGWEQTRVAVLGAADQLRRRPG